MAKWDFTGWATKANLKCSDGRTIMQNAFKDDDGRTVPLVWNHQHNDPTNVLGHALLENRPEGVFAYCKFNDSEAGKTAKLLVQHGDVNALSIWANQLTEKMSQVYHGVIREVSLVLAGANPGASIQSVLEHSDGEGFEAEIFTGENIELYHADEEEGTKKTSAADDSKKNSESEKKDDEETIEDVFNTLSEKQKNAVYVLIGAAVEDAEEESDDDDSADGDNSKGGNDNTMKHNVFDNDEKKQENVLSHDAMQTIVNDAKRYGSLKDSFLAHAEEYGIQDIDWLFPEARTLNNPPEFIKRDTGWVSKVMGAVHKSPFSRIKSVFADITEDEARAKGYMKGKLKKEEVFSLLKRTTTPTTVYKKQKMDRDDVIDITDFDVVAWIKGEMRMMLDEELARAILIGDGRLASSDDKINEQNIRPISKEEELFAVQSPVTVTTGATDDDKAKEFIRTVIKSRKQYKGSGNPVLYTTEDWVTNCLLLTDANGRDLYDSVDKLATKLRVREIVTVEAMENAKGKDDKPLIGILVNLNDYNVGADKGGSINMFDDFDIDYNQQKYLIETRCSGALTKPYSAIVYTLNEGE